MMIAAVEFVKIENIVNLLIILHCRCRFVVKTGVHYGLDYAVYRTLPTHCRFRVMCTGYLTSR